MAIDCWLDSLDGRTVHRTHDLGNGNYRRHLSSEFGGFEPSVSRTRLFCLTAALKSYAWRGPEIVGAILAGFVLALSTRKFSAAAVGRVTNNLQRMVTAFRARSLANRCKTLMLDGVMLARAARFVDNTVGVVHPPSSIADWSWPWTERPRSEKAPNRECNGCDWGEVLFVQLIG